MSINRNNYEEYFLLYTDNELSASERTAVEDFILQNPDLKEELMMLQEAVLLPEPVSLENRGALLHAENVSSSLQEKLLLLLDGELDNNTAAALNAALEKDAEISKEWELLKQTKLSANDQIIFADKATLYKKEKGKLIPMGWRIAAAAMLIGFGVWSTVAYLNRSNGSSATNGLATSPVVKPVEGEPVKKLVEQTFNQDSATSNIATADMGKITTAVKKNAGEIITRLVLPADKKALPAKDLVTKDPAAINKKPSNNLPEPVLEKINRDGSNNPDVASVPSLNKKELKALDNPVVTEAAQPYAINTAFNDNNDEKVTYGFDEEDQPKKTKVGGFFKKLNRVLQRKANIKTSSDGNFKVANLSFAVQ